MNEDEINNTDLYTIYKLIDVHAKFNNHRSVTKNKNIQEERDSYIDNISF